MKIRRSAQGQDVSFMVPVSCEIEEQLLSVLWPLTTSPLIMTWFSLVAYTRSSVGLYEVAYSLWLVYISRPIRGDILSLVGIHQ